MGEKIRRRKIKKYTQNALTTRLIWTEND